VVGGKPWVLLGDFNVALNLEDNYSGSSFLNSAVEFKDCVAKIEPYRISDHSFSVLKIPDLPMNKPKSFKFFNFITHKSKFLDVVAAQWSEIVNGHYMYQVTTKMRALRKLLRKLVHDHGNLHERVNKLRHELDEVQKALDLCHSDQNLHDEEAIYIQAFNEANRIDVIVNVANVELSGFNVLDAFVKHYKLFLGANMMCDDLKCDGLFNKCVSEQSREHMILNVSDSKIKFAMFSIGDDRALGPDGYTELFSKRGGVPTPLRINDYHPISCCNVIYKCISKILTNRIIKGIKEVVSDNQSAFVPGRRISDNILITQELMHNYHRQMGPPRCAFKIDIQKAYDTVDWRFLGCVLKLFGFHPLMIIWITACVTSTSFSICVNGDVHVFFKGKCGLRQGDPLSPYLFTLVRVVLMLILQRRVRASHLFRYHKHCEDLDLINICFADDLFIFIWGDVESARVIMESLDEFKSVSGLVPSLSKSTSLFCNVKNHVKSVILNAMPFLGHSSSHLSWSAVDFIKTLKSRL
nr:hypothetical protein [Tanacetum cinerariifolium]